MSDQAVLLPKLVSQGGIILAKGWLDHSYTFWTMANYAYYTSTKFADSHVISNIPITEGMNIILNKNTTAIIVLNYVHFQ